MLLFFIGIVEMFIVAAWTKWVVEERILASGAISMINVLVWYYVLQTLVSDLGNIYLVILYAAGCAFGTMLSGAVSARYGKEKQAFSAPEATPLALNENVI